MKNHDAKIKQLTDTCLQLVDAMSQLNGKMAEMDKRQAEMEKTCFFEHQALEKYGEIVRAHQKFWETLAAAKPEVYNLPVHDTKPN